MSEHLLVFPDRDDAERIAEELREEGFTEVRVVQDGPAGDTADDTTARGWALYVREEAVEDDTSAVGQGLQERFEALAEERDASYDPQPGSFRV